MAIIWTTPSLICRVAHYWPQVEHQPSRLDHGESSISPVWKSIAFSRPQKISSGQDATYQLPSSYSRIGAHACVGMHHLL